MSALRYAALAAFAILVAPSAVGHPGRTDASGGHYNRKTGEYHYHGGGRAVSPPPSQPSSVVPTIQFLTPRPSNSDKPTAAPSDPPKASLPTTTTKKPETIRKPLPLVRHWHTVKGEEFAVGTYQRSIGNRIQIASTGEETVSIVFDQLSTADRASIISINDGKSEHHAAHRLWTSANGKYNVLAKALAIDGKTVLLRTSDARVINVPFEKLSDADNSYLKRLQEVLASPLPASESDNPFESVESFKGRPAGSSLVSAAPPVNSVSESPAQLTHWLNTESNVRHNNSCRWYGKTKAGRKCAADDGKPCGVCGG